jgi:hypothetical protein
MAVFFCGLSSVRVFAQTGSVVTVDSNNVLVVNGRKVFSIGFSPGPPNNSVTPWGKDAMQEFSDAGALLFRINQTNNWNSQLITIQQAALDWAGQHGMYCWLNLRELSQFASTDTNTPASLRNIVDTFRNHPALGLWKNYDEAWWSGIPAANLSNGYYVIKQEDLNHPVVQTHAPRGTVADLQPYNVAADVLALDIYPVCIPPANNPPITNTSISQVGDWTDVLGQVANGQKEYWLIEQIASSGTTPPNHTLVFPTFTQSRFMAYEAIIDGARGLMFFGGNIAATLNAQDAPYGWNWTFWTNVLKPVVQELGGYGLLTNALVAPNSSLSVTISGTSVPDIEFCVREASPFLYVLASKREGTNVTVTFSGLPTSAGTGDVLYEGPRTVTAQNGQFTDSFVPFDVHVYRFNLTNQLPTITQQPLSRTNNPGTTASFSVAASGTGTLAYQWYKNNLSLADGANVSGSTATTLTLSNVQPADAGTYVVQVTDSTGFTPSPNAILTVVGPISITSQPASQTNTSGTIATFAVGVTGSNPQFQWYKNGTNLANGGNISGATTDTLTLANVQNRDAGTYSVLVTNVFNQMMSSNAVLGIINLAITGQPASRTNIAGTTASFSVGAQGSQLGYDWLRGGIPLVNGGNVSGATTATLTLSSVLSGDAASYSVVVSNATGSLTSAPATLTVLFPMPYYEPFNYPAGSHLGGQTNANLLTWSDVGTSTAGPYVTNIAGGLSLGGLPASAGNSTEFGGLGKSARFSFASGNTVSSGTLYYSFLLKVLDTTGLSSSGIFFAGFNNTMGTQTAQPSVVGTRLYIRSATGGFNLGVAKNSSTSSDWVWDTAHVYTNGQVILVVGAYTFNTNSSTDDVSSLWLNPNPSAFGSANPPSPTATATTGPDISSGVIASFVLFQRDLTEPAAAIVDELRIGTTWASVTALPAPTATWLTGLTRLGNGTIQFTYTDGTGQSGTVYASTNLVNWSPLGPATQISPGQYQFSDSAAGGFPRRFYQLRWP